ncbi:DUF6212 domain-containing protein [Aureimonas sp. AU40]|uniref:DUF6212 domain-containing protein n=1 Tax=Aureimonas sp. AU40 TaxID=1637747 RepID=UPI00078432DD|nr:DUF6212 domain-containing protein [Aureimonas sp. AU40]
MPSRTSIPHRAASPLPPPAPPQATSTALVAAAPRSLASLLSGPIVFSCDADPAARAPAACPVLTLLRFERGVPVILWGGAARPLLDAPALPLAILAGEPESDTPRRLVAWLGERGLAPPPVLAWQKGGEEMALRQLAALLRREAIAADRSAERARADVRRVALMNRRLRERFTSAEEALTRRGALPFAVALTNEPARSPAQTLPLGEGTGALRQILPLASTGLAAVAVHLSGVPESGAAPLLAELRTLEDGATVGRWAVPGERLSSGWAVLALARALSGQQRTLELHLSAGPEGLPVQVSLGVEQPIPDFQVQAPGLGPITPNALALQLWRGLPGAGVPEVEGHHRPAGERPARGGFRERAVAPARLLLASHANPDMVRFEFPAVEAPPGEGSVICHPPSHGLTLGVLPGAVPPKAVRVSASVHVANERAQAVDFALCAAPDAERAKALFEGRARPEAGEALGPFCRVPHGETRRISAFSAGLGESAQDLFIATRMSTPGDNSYAWARFSHFSVLEQP